MVVPEASINNIMGGLENTAGVRLHNHRRKLKQRFDIVRKLGQGTYGKVQLGINKETGQEVAIKTIKKCKIETEADLIRIRREIQIMSSVQHPNIIHIYEVFENREKMVLVMEYAAGGELYDYLSEKKVLTEEEARRLFRQIATAIYYCHKHKICHRDLKLENVLLDEHGSAKIADFGLSNVFDDCRLLSTFCGSPLYASPEIVKGTPYLGPEVDCWSLGVLLYTLVYGAMPFDGSNFKRLVRQISQGDYFEPKKPSPASPLIREMLNVNPSRRADITAICSHWWVDDGQSESCLDIAEELANQTPVRLDLLLSLAPSAVCNDKLLIPDQGATVEGGAPVLNDRPLRSQSLGSLATTGQLDFIPELPTPAQQREQDTSKTSTETTERRRKERSRSRRRDRSSSRSRKHDKQRDDSTSDASISETKPHRKSSKSSRKKLEDSESKKEVSDNKTVVPSKMEVDENKENVKSVNKDVVENLDEKMDVELSEKPEKVVKEDKIKDKVEKDVPKEVNKEVDKSVKAELKTDKVEIGKDKVADNKTDEKRKEKPKKDVVKDKIEDKKIEDDKQLLDDISVKENKDVIMKDKSEEPKPKDDKKKKEEEQAIDDDKPSKPIERRKSKIFETAEKLISIQQMEQVKPPPKKVFLPGVKVSDAKKAYERKSSLVSSSSFVKPNLPRRNSAEPSSPTTDFDKKFLLASTVALNKLVEDVEKLSKQEEENQKQSAVVSSENKEEDVEKTVVNESEKPVEEVKSEIIPEAPKVTNEVKNGDKPKMVENVISNAVSDEAQKKSATLPRRKTSRAEIKLAAPKPVKPEFHSEVQHMVAAPSTPTYQQRSEVVFPVAAVTERKSTPPLSTPKHTSSQPQLAHKPPPIAKQDSLPREHIIPIQVENELPTSKSQPVVQRSISRNDSQTQSLSRQSTLDSDSGSVTSQGEPIRKSPREVIIPIAVEGGGYVTPSVETITRMSSLNESEDELSSRGFGLHSARKPKKQLETADSISSDEDDDNFEILTAENLFSTLLSRVRNLTHRLNTEENRSSAFPRLFNHHHSLFDNSPSRRLSEARSFSRNDVPWRRSMSRDNTSSSTLPRDLSGRSSVHRVLPQRSSDSSTKIPQRSTSFRSSNEKPPPYRSKYLRSLSENVNKDNSRMSQQKSELANISEHTHTNKNDSSNLRESTPKDENGKNTLTVSEDKSNVSSNSDLSESYKTAKNSRAESVEMSNAKCSEDQQKKFEMKTTNSCSDVSEISQSSDSKSLSKSTDDRRYDNTSRTSSSLFSNQMASLSESRISSLNSTLPKFRRSSLLDSISGRNRNNSSELDKIRTDFRSQSSSPLTIKQRRSSYVDDYNHGSNLRYSTLNPSRYNNTSSLRRRSRDSPSFYGSSLSDRISSEDIEKFRSEFRKGFKPNENSSKTQEKNAEIPNQESISTDDIVTTKSNSQSDNVGEVLDGECSSKVDDKAQNIPTSSKSTPDKNISEKIVKENNSELNKELNDIVSEEDLQSASKYSKPKCPIPYESSGAAYPTAMSKRYNRPKSLYANFNTDNLSSNLSSNSIRSPSVLENQNRSTSSSKIPNYRRTLSLNSGEKQPASRELKHSHSSVTPDRSVLGKFFEKSSNRSDIDSSIGNSFREDDHFVNEESLKQIISDENDDKIIKSVNRRVSRFLRPDFYDTPLEESTYIQKKVKDSASSSSKTEKKRLSRVDCTIKALRESSLGPKECDIIDRESTLIKRAVSLDDVSSVPKKQRAKRSSSVNYEKNAEAVKTIQKFIRKSKLTSKSDDRNKTALVSNGNCNNSSKSNNNNVCDKPESSRIKEDESVTKKTLKSYNTRLKTDIRDSPSRRSSTTTYDHLSKNSPGTSNRLYNSNIYDNYNYKTDNETDNYAMKKSNSLETNRQTRAMRIAALEKFDFSRSYSSPDSTPNFDESYDNMFDDNSSSLLLLSPNDDNSDSYSASSDYLDARDYIALSPTSLNAAEESVSERIRRKSFYSRFNQLKKKKNPPQTQSNINISGMMGRSRLPTYRRSFTSADYIDPSINIANNVSNEINNNSNSNNI